MRKIYRPSFSQFYTVKEYRAHFIIHSTKTRRGREERLIYVNERKCIYKYGRNIIHKTINQIPFSDSRFSGKSEYEIRLELIRILWGPDGNGLNNKNCPEGRFGEVPFWKIKIHFILGYGILHYYPEWPSRKHGLCVMYGKRRK